MQGRRHGREGGGGWGRGGGGGRAPQHVPICGGRKRGAIGEGWEAHCASRFLLRVTWPCSPSSPVLSKSYMDMTRKLITFTFTRGQELMCWLVLCVLRPQSVYISCVPGGPFGTVWYLVCDGCRLTVVWVDCRCVLSFLFLGAPYVRSARRLELSPCYTRPGALAMAMTILEIIMHVHQDLHFRRTYRSPARRSD